VDSLRFVVCAQPACAQVFFLCPRCDRGQWYCGRACATAVRRATLRAAGARYQDTRRGRRQHAARQARYRERSREKVTHHPPRDPPGSGMSAPAR